MLAAARLNFLRLRGNTSQERGVYTSTVIAMWMCGGQLPPARSP